MASARGHPAVPRLHRNRHWRRRFGGGRKGNLPPSSGGLRHELSLLSGPIDPVVPTHRGFRVMELPRSTVVLINYFTASSCLSMLFSTSFFHSMLTHASGSIRMA